MNAWIDSTDWMPRRRPPDGVERYYAEELFPRSEVWVVGDPVEGYAVVNPETSEIASLYAARPGKGTGKRLLDRVKEGRDRLDLWTFVANGGARRFYAREGFRGVEFTDGDNDEGLPDVRMRWDRDIATRPRRAERSEVPRCAAIIDDWIEATPWVVRDIDLEGLIGHIDAAFDQREIWVVGDPPVAYMSVDDGERKVGALYCSETGAGHGKRLLDRAKAGRDFLWLTTHEPNKAAHRFYEREGFAMTGEPPTLDGEAYVLRMEWRR